MILNNNNLDIFVCSHKQYESPVHNEVYKTLSLGNNTELYGDNIIRDDTGDNISDMNPFYCELSGLYWIWKNYDIKEYIGFCHYRRYFDFFDKLPKDIEDYDIILPIPLSINTTVYEHYTEYHNGDDLKLVYDIMIEKYNVPKEIANEILNNRTYMSFFNMFICNRTFFNKYCEFIFGILDDYLKYHNISNINDVYQMVEENIDNYLKNFYPNNTISYQSRIGGYLSERLFNVFVALKNPKIKYFNVLMIK